MRLVEPHYEILTEFEGEEVLKFLEKVARTSTMSYDLITEDSYQKFIPSLLERKHYTVFENYSITVKWCTSRAILDEIRTHRIGSHIMSSTRYCNYSKDRFGNELRFVTNDHCMKTAEIFDIWIDALRYSETNYFKLLECGLKPEQARDILPLDIYSEMVTTMNLRSWRNFFELRCDKATHIELRKLSVPLLKDFQTTIPYVFEDIKY